MDICMFQVSHFRKSDIIYVDAPRGLDKQLLLLLPLRLPSRRRREQLAPLVAKEGGDGGLKRAVGVTHFKTLPETVTV